MRLCPVAIFLPHEDGFSKVKNTYIKSAYYNIYDDRGINQFVPNIRFLYPLKKSEN